LFIELIGTLLKSIFSLWQAVRWSCECQSLCLSWSVCMWLRMRRL